MSLLFYDGFEGLEINAPNVLGLRLRYNEWPPDNWNVIRNDQLPAPLTGFAFQQGGEGPVGRGFTKYLPAHAEGVVGFRTCPTTVATAIPTGRFLVLRDGSDVDHLSFNFTVGGEVEVWRGAVGATLLGTTSGAGFTAATLTYLEIKYAIDDTNGGVHIRTHAGGTGTDVLKLGAYADAPTTLDTRNGGTAAIERVRWELPASNGHIQFDDIYVIDTAGGELDDFLGECRVLEVVATGAGDSADFTPNTGANFAATNETRPNGAGTYVESATPGDEDFYVAGAPASDASTVYAVKVVAVARKSDAGAQDLELLLKAGATVDASPPIALGDTDAEFEHMLFENPATSGAWGINDVAQIGFRVPA